MPKRKLLTNEVNQLDEFQNLFNEINTSEKHLEKAFNNAKTKEHDKDQLKKLVQQLEEYWSQLLEDALESSDETLSNPDKIKFSGLIADIELKILKIYKFKDGSAIPTKTLYSYLLRVYDYCEAVKTYDGKSNTDLNQRLNLKKFHQCYEFLFDFLNDYIAPILNITDEKIHENSDKLEEIMCIIHNNYFLNKKDHILTNARLYAIELKVLMLCLCASLTGDKKNFIEAGKLIPESSDERSETLNKFITNFGLQKFLTHDNNESSTTIHQKTISSTAVQPSNMPSFDLNHPEILEQEDTLNQQIKEAVNKYMEIMKKIEEAVWNKMALHNTIKNTNLSDPSEKNALKLFRKQLQLISEKINAYRELQEKNLSLKTEKNAQHEQHTDVQIHKLQQQLQDIKNLSAKMEIRLDFYNNMYNLLYLEIAFLHKQTPTRKNSCLKRSETMLQDYEKKLHGLLDNEASFFPFREKEKMKSDTIPQQILNINQGKTT